MMWVLVMGCVLWWGSLVGVSYSLFRWVFDAEWGSCEVGVLLMYR